MGYKLRQFDAEGKFCQFLTLDVVKRVVPRDTITTVLDEQHVRTLRERKFHLVVTLWVVLAMTLYAHISIGHVFVRWLEDKLVAVGVRKVSPDQDTLAIAYRRMVRLSRVQQAMDTAIAALPPDDAITVPAHLVQQLRTAIDGIANPGMRPCGSSHGRRRQNSHLNWWRHTPVTNPLPLRVPCPSPR